MLQAHNITKQKHRPKISKTYFCSLSLLVSLNETACCEKMNTTRKTPTIIMQTKQTEKNNTKTISTPTKKSGDDENTRVHTIAIAYGFVPNQTYFHWHLSPWFHSSCRDSKNIVDFLFNINNEAVGKNWGKPAWIWTHNSYK